jgi:hypothetical protein
VHEAAVDNAEEAEAIAEEVATEPEASVQDRTSVTTSTSTRRKRWWRRR